MLPVRVLVLGDRRAVIFRLRAALEVEGYLVVAAVAASAAPAPLLSKISPDLVIAHFAGPARPRLEAWRRAVETFRARHALSVLGLAGGGLDAEERRVFESFADLGILGRPFQRKAVLACLERWYASETPLLRAS